MAVITDYQRGYANMGATIGGGIRSAGQQIGSAVQKIPDMRLKQKEYEELTKKIEKAEKDEQSFNESKRAAIDNVLEFYGNKKEMSPKKLQQIEQRLSTASTREEFATSLMTLEAWERVKKQNASELGGAAKLFDLEPSLLGSEDYYEWVVKQGENNLAARKQSMMDQDIGGFLQSTVKDQSMGQEEAYRKFVTQNPQYSGNESIRKMFDSAFTSFKEQTGRIKAEADMTRATTAATAPQKEKSNATDFSRVKSQFDRLTKDYSMERVRSDIDKARQVAINLETQRIMQDGVTTWADADEQAKAKVSGLTYAQLDDLLTKLTWKDDAPAEPKGGWSKLFSGIGQMISKVRAATFGDDEETSGTTNATERQPAKLQGGRGMDAGARQYQQDKNRQTESDEERRARLRSALYNK